ncbi:MAG: hypothetical protein KAR08_08660, partial [Candidatus Heimdallarchaeota archaeon]|nr:hypothetical protein [Candidatus Heimdallarchaeota archaeon]
ETPLITGADGSEPAVDPTELTKTGDVTPDTQGGNGANADTSSEGRRNRNYQHKVAKAEALRALETAEMRVRAKELLAKEKELDARIRHAKESAKPRALVNSPRGTYAQGGKTSAVEAEISKPSAWFRAVQREENVSPAFIWHINKEKIYENYGKQYYKKFDAQGNEIRNPVPKNEVGKQYGGEAVTISVAGPADGDFMRIMSEQVLVLPDGKVVTPIRQFCETKILPPGTREAFFYDFGPVTFSDIVEGDDDPAVATPLSSPIIRSAGTETDPRGTRIDIGYQQTEESPIDIIASANRSFALESINDESVEVLTRAYNLDTGSSGSATVRKAKGGGTKAGRWVDGNTGAQITVDGAGLGVLSYRGLLAGKGVIQDEGLDDSNLITYTSGKGIRDLTLDPDLDSYIGFSRPAIITEATVERIAGTNLVRTSAVAPSTQAGGVRSAMFIPNVAFGLVSGRDLTMEAQRRNERQIIHLTGTQKISAVVKNVEATVRLSHI